MVDVRKALLMPGPGYRVEIIFAIVKALKENQSLIFHKDAMTHICVHGPSSHATVRQVEGP
jgi:hypothetical protein